MHIAPITSETATHFSTSGDSLGLFDDHALSSQDLQYSQIIPTLLHSLQNLSDRKMDAADLRQLMRADKWCRDWASSEEKGFHVNRDGTGFAKIDIDVGMGRNLASEWVFEQLQHLCFSLMERKFVFLFYPDKLDVDDCIYFSSMNSRVRMRMSWGHKLICFFSGITTFVQLFNSQLHLNRF